MCVKLHSTVKNGWNYGKNTKISKITVLTGSGEAWDEIGDAEQDKLDKYSYILCLNVLF